VFAGAEAYNPEIKMALIFVVVALPQIPKVEDIP
jgi:hypothetical protein